jgi:hypothetical protein
MAGKASAEAGVVATSPAATPTALALNTPRRLILAVRLVSLSWFVLSIVILPSRD